MTRIASLNGKQNKWELTSSQNTRLPLELLDLFKKNVLQTLLQQHDLLISDVFIFLALRVL